MKNLFLCAVGLVVYSTNLFSQNYVPNYSFETYTACPTGLAQINNVPPWYSPSVGSPDFFHACGSIPNGALGKFGAQATRTGTGYGNLVIYNAGELDYTEYLQIQLTTPLTAGTTYFVEFYVSRGERGNYALGAIGAYLSVAPISSVLRVNFNVTPQVENLSTAVITDNTNWTQISGSFIATGGEEYLTIGSFYPDAARGITNVGGGIWNSAYYYIEDVCIVGPGGSCLTVLPIKLLDFKLLCEKQSNIITWKTASEINNDYFTIERSADGINFETIGLVNGAGNSNGLLSYSWADDSPLKQTAYYRLKQTDFDGKFSYSKIIVGNCDLNCDLKIYPNPFKNSFTVQLSSEIDFPITIKIQDFLGRNVYKETITNKQFFEVSMPNNISSGTYFINVFNEKISITEKIIKVN